MFASPGSATRSTNAAKPATTALGGYRDPKPMVFSGLYPIDGSDYPDLRDALDKLKLNDAALVYEPETSAALGFGFRIGFLGMLHLEIVRERLEREFDLDLISTLPNVVYDVTLDDGTVLTVANPSEFPYGKVDLGDRAGGAGDRPGAERVHRRDHGAVPAEARLAARHGLLSEERVEMRYTLPLAEIVFDFFDQLKSRTRGYASLDYEPDGDQVADLVKVDIMLQGETVDAFSSIVHKDKAYAYGVMMAGKLKDLIPRQQFEVPIQAAIGSRIIARENIRAIREDVLAKCYGGDISRKRKLLEKQKAGKKRMKNIGTVEVPPEAFIAALSSDGHAAEASLKRLGTDRIDLYYAHQDDDSQTQEAVLEAFGKLVDAGKVRVIGASNFHAARLKSAVEAAKTSDLPRYHVLQPEYNLVSRTKFEGELQDYCVTENIGVLPYYGLASGFLTGKYRTKDDLGQSVRGGRMGELLEGTGKAVLDAMDSVVEATGATHAQVALAWLIAQPGVTAPIASATSVKQIEDLLPAMTLELSKDQLDALMVAGA